ncbi:hypothetical protein C9374_008745 [Naegleria lovaniensis]|uniref:Uncharacterized protein n=1 Tax=Naegleria lovaniensis TaxID=51637 RepID=A0AA88GGI9_NAELO|nr:uncharacterized protein C9374_008745 [Naegleria lovaniensis]KAG2378123.1 hypothetical protein C9374_008745 [Naegleria lovaniensis]
MASGALLLIEGDNPDTCKEFNQIVFVPVLMYDNNWKIHVLFPRINEESIDNFEISFRKLTKNQVKSKATCIIEYPPKPKPKFSLFGPHKIEIVDHKISRHEIITNNETFCYTKYELTLQPSEHIMQSEFSSENRKIFDVSLKTNRDDHFVRKIAVEFYRDLCCFTAVQCLQTTFTHFESNLYAVTTASEDSFKKIALYSKMFENRYSPQSEFVSRVFNYKVDMKLLEQIKDTNTERIVELLSEDPAFILYTLCFDSSYTEEEKQVTQEYLSKIYKVQPNARNWIIPFESIQSLPLYPKLLLARKKSGFDAIFGTASRLLSTGLFVPTKITKDELIEASMLFYFKTKSLEIIP